MNSFFVSICRCQRSGLYASKPDTPPGCQTGKFSGGHGDRVNPVVKLTDFDLACPVEQARSFRRVGTPAYMAPEQFRSKISLKASDVFAFGVMAYQLCSGRFPFSGNSERQTLRNQSDETTKPRPLSDFVRDISPRLERVILRSLAKRTQERYPDMNAFLNDLTS